MIRQGDVLLIPTQVSQKPVLNRTGIEIKGERTGHSHRLEGEVQEGNVIHVLKDTEMTHEEHNAVNVAEGFYEVRLQREFSPTSRGPISRAKYD